MKKLFLLFAILLTVTTAHAQMEKGYRGFFEIGHNFGKYTLPWDAKTNNQIIVSTTHGYQINNLFFVGGGASIGRYEYEEFWGDGSIYTETKTVFTYFGDFRYDMGIEFLNPRLSPYIDFKIGGFHTDNWDEGAYIAPQIGLRYAISPSCGINIGLSYQGLITGIQRSFFQGIGLSLGVDF